MTCLRSTDGKMHICGNFGRRNTIYFDPKRRYVLFCDSLWYEANLVEKLKRKKHERIDYFERRVKRKLGYLPQSWATYRRKFLIPQFRQIDAEREKNQQEAK